jgi:ABC-type transport system involved in multi-copper enzyme maturation permease subunit
MKFLAILRDSVREAIDYKVIYFLVALSALVILVAASVSYQPEPGEKGLQDIVNRLPGAEKMFGGPAGPLRYQIEDFKQLNEGQPVWQGEFRCTLVASEAEPPSPNEADEEDAKAKKKAQQKAKESPSVLRLLTLVDLVKRQSEGHLEPEDEETYKKLEKINRESLREVDKLNKKAGGQPIPAAAVRNVLTKAFQQSASLVTHDQITRFLRSKLSSTGTLDVTELKLTSEEARAFRFDLECKARPETIRTWPHTPILFFGALKLPFTTGVAPWVMSIESWIVTGMGAGLTLLLSTVVTAFFVPNMMRKGTIDLLISKPIHRWYLLVCKFVGGLSFMFINTVVIIVGIWLVLGFRTGLWSTGFLLGILVLTLQFAILYSVSVLAGVLTRNAIVSILVTCVWWFILYGVGNAYLITDMFREAEIMPTWVHTTIDTVHFVLPHYKDLDILSQRLIARELLPADSPDLQVIDRLTKSIKWATSLSITGGFIALLLALASWRFSAKDY